MKRLLKGLFTIVLVVVTTAVVLYLIAFDYVSAGERGTWPNLGKGAWVVVSRRAQIERGDLVLFKTPKDQWAIRRVIALPGEKLSVKVDSRPVVDGVAAKQEEVKAVEIEKHPYRILRETLGERSYLVFDDQNRRVTGEHPEKVVEGGYYLMTDNREHAQDSRTMGPIAKEKIRGVVIWQPWRGSRPWE